MEKRNRKGSKMPYKIMNDKEIWSQSGGKWHKKQTCKNHAAAVNAMQLLYGIEENPKFAKAVKKSAKKGK